jgi:mannose-6-phosphate isomerase-like protein (cupin superfamily)
VAASPQRLELLGFRVTFLHAEPDSPVSMLEWDAPPGAGGIPLHVHERTTEGFYVLRGRIALQLGEERVVRGAGSYTVVPPGHPHTFWNPGDEPAAYLTPIAPGGFEGYLRELALGLAAAPSEPEAAALRARLAERYDITVVGPPPRTEPQPS